MDYPPQGPQYSQPQPQYQQAQYSQPQYQQPQYSQPQPQYPQPQYPQTQPPFQQPQWGPQGDLRLDQTNNGLSHLFCLSSLGIWAFTGSMLGKLALAFSSCLLVVASLVYGY